MKFFEAMRAIRDADEGSFRAAEIVVLTMLLMRRNTTETDPTHRNYLRCDPSLTTLARDCHMRRDSTLLALRGLEEKGVLAIERGNRRTSSKYGFDFAKLAALTTTARDDASELKDALDPVSRTTRSAGEQSVTTRNGPAGSGPDSVPVSEVAVVRKADLSGPESVLPVVRKADLSGPVFRTVSPNGSPNEDPKNTPIIGGGSSGSHFADEARSPRLGGADEVHAHYIAERKRARISTTNVKLSPKDKQTIGRLLKDGETVERLKIAVTWVLHISEHHTGTSKTNSKRFHQLEYALRSKNIDDANVAHEAKAERQKRKEENDRFYQRPQLADPHRAPSRTAPLSREFQELFRSLDGAPTANVAPTRPAGAMQAIAAAAGVTALGDMLPTRKAGAS